MKGIIQNFKRGRKVHHPNFVVVDLDDVTTKVQARTLLGKKAFYKTLGGKMMQGKVSSTHGDKGAVLIRFTKGLPGQAVGMTIEVK